LDTTKNHATNFQPFSNASSGVLTAVANFSFYRFSKIVATRYLWNIPQDFDSEHDSIMLGSEDLEELRNAIDDKISPFKSFTNGQ
jgi:hypothetical protein